MKANTVQTAPGTTVGGADVLAFATELGALGAVAVWGWHSGGWMGALGTALTFGTVWGVFLSPRAAVPVTGVWWPLAKLAVFAVSALALSTVAGVVPAAALLSLALLSAVLGGTR
ncbi:hypothetical protein HNQ07_000797 [Deinococcus metalli]|nr:YrdB family protein [Deinococcus metalli]MBB5375353.1 hypothetical protein [Deinococcus metalli]